MSSGAEHKTAVGAAPLELRWRLSLLIGVLLTATLAVAAVVATMGAREAVEREVGASLRTAESSLDLIVDLLAEVSPDRAEDVLRKWAGGYADGRHLCIAIVPMDTAGVAGGCRIPEAVPGVPLWFSRGVNPSGPIVSRTVEGSGGALRIDLVSDPGDELREAWTDASGLLALIGVLALIVNVGVFVALSRGLQPLGELVRAMDRIGRGQPVGLRAGRGAHEMQVLAEGLHELAERLKQSRDIVGQLHLRNLDLQEEERRMVARELHDEIGHHVAAIEMETIRIARMTPEDETLRQARLQQLRASIAEIHRVSRDLIRRLRPPAIESLGLSAALEAMLDRWIADHPDVDLRYEIAPACDRTAVTRAVHVYRIVQEALSNIARHARARNAWVRLWLDGEQVRLEMADDGVGFDPDRAVSGFGLVGIRERVEALAGTLEVHSGTGRGTRLAAAIPVMPSPRTDPSTSRPMRPEPLLPAHAEAGRVSEQPGR